MPSTIFAAAERMRKATARFKSETEGRWVTTSQGNRLFIGEDGVARTGPGGKVIETNAGDGRTLKRIVDEGDVPIRFAEQGARIKEYVER